MNSITSTPINIFLDTQVLRRLSFDWHHPDLISLRRRIEKGSIQVLTSEIVIKECERQLHGMLNEYRQAIVKTRTKAQFLDHAAPELIDDLDKLANEIPSSQRIKQSAVDFFTSLGATIVPYPSTVQSLFDLYFSGHAPFGAKGKKSEFPDAANLISLIDFASKNSIPVFVVSGDDDWRRVAEQSESIFLISSLGEALGMGIRLEWTDDELWSDEELLSHIENSHEELKSTLHLALTFDSRVNLGDGELNHLTIHTIEPTYFVITDIREEGTRLKCRGELHYDIDYSAEISLGDAEMNEEFEKEVEGNEQLVATLEFEFQASNPEKIKNLQASHLDGLELELPMDVV